MSRRLRLLVRQAVGTATVLALLGLAGCGEPSRPEGTIRLGHFPNVTHAQALVAHQLSRRGTGWFEPRLGCHVEWYVFNAGPSAMEALLAGALDATYVGPNPALNAHLRARGEEVRLLAGSARGGAALVVREASGITGPADLRGRRIATPQLGNTQDVACRAWLAARGLRVTLTGGDATVLPTPNPDQLALFLRGELDAAWTVEPWVTRLEQEAGGRVLFEEADAVTTVLAASRSLVEGAPGLARRLATAHAELTRWVREHPTEAQALAQAEIEALTSQRIPDAVLAGSWPRIRLTTEVDRADFESFVSAARAAGFLPDAIPLDRFVVTP